MSTRKLIEDLYPLSALQEGLLFHSLYESGTGAYEGQTGFEILGELDEDAFRRAWEGVMERHPVLRSSFVWDKVERPLQMVRRRVALPLHREDWRDMDPREQAERLAAYLADDRARGLDPGKAPMMRLALFRTGERAHQLVWTHHHAILDGWSLPVLFREVLLLYQAHARSEPAALPAVRPYRDYIAWLEGQDLGRAERFWREALAGFTTPTLLEGGAPRAAGDGARFATCSATLPDRCAGSLRALAQREGLTLNTVVQGAWALLLSRYTGQEDVLFGVTVSGRPAELEGVEGMVGLFINTLPARVRARPDADLPGWLRELQARQAELREYEYTPLVQVQGWSEVPAGQPFFESILVFENFPLDESLRQGGWDLQVRPNVSADETHYPLALGVVLGAEVRLDLGHDRERYDDDFAERLLRHLVVLLEGIAADPERRVGELPMLDAAERTRVVEEFNRTARPRPHAGLHQRVAEQAARAPEAVALVHGGESLTRGELERRANRLAHHLRGRGVAPETRVAVAMERGTELVVALLAILKAGGAYVPVDSQYPAERRAYMLQDSGAAVLLTRGAAAGDVPGFTGTVVDLDRDGAEVDARPDTAPDVELWAESAAYVIYTSGSTGTPKGVVVTHGSIVNYLLGICDFYRLSPSDRMLQFASISFDTSVEEIFATLVAGATLVLRDEDMLASPARYFERCAEWGITVMEFTTPHWHELAIALERGEARLPASVRLASVGGDRMLPERVAGWLRCAGDGAELVNGYGPTEGTIVSTATYVRAGEPVTIGTPVDNVRAYVVEPGLEPAPVGVPGELYVAGAGLARGYLGRPELTAEKFVPDPFGEPGGRLYRTGDRVRWTPTGELEYLGRMDQQVKIRGFRVEPGEVEAALLAHPRVRDAVVVVREDEPGEKRLVAYAVPRAEGDEPAPGELRRDLAARLPEHMLPADVVVLAALPLNASGKVDRGALPAPARSAGDPGARTAPRTPAEELIARIWESVLQVDGVGVHDSFFELGGHSLLATRVVSRVRQTFGVEVPLRALFEEPTVAALAERVESGFRSGAAREAPPIGRADRGGALPLSFAQQRLWFIDQLEPGSAAYNMSGALRLRGPLDVAALGRSLDALVARHETLRTRFPAVDGRPVQHVEPAGSAAARGRELRELELRGTPEAGREEAVQRLAREEAALPFDLAAGPLLRTALARVDAAEWVLVFTMHHIVSDGWSMEVLVREVTELYAAYARGEEPALPELPIQYADYAAWQRSWLQGEALEAQLAYWRGQLRGAPPLLDVPTDRPRTSVREARAGVCAVELPAAAADGLRALSQREGTTLFMTLLGAWQALLGRYTADEDVVVGTPIAGRSRLETEGLIGFFVNMLVLRADLSGDPTVAELLGRVRETTLGAYAHQDLPFEKLVDELGVERSLAHAPLFQAAFALQVPAGGELRLGEVQVEPLRTARASLPFDLELSVADTGERLSGVLSYRADLFDASTAEWMLGRYRLLLEGMAAQPRRRLSELALLDDAERRQLLQGGSRAPSSRPFRPVHELFREQAARTPDAPAVLFGAEALTYAELERRSGRLADRLRRLGVGPEVRVAVCLERGPELVAAVLGVLGAGGAYVPLDPAYPPARLAHVLHDSAAPVLLTEDGLAERLPAVDAAVLVLNGGTEYEVRSTPHTVASGDYGSSSAPSHSQSLAYVIYTSGSTGTPKGVLVEHGGLANLLEGCRDAFGVRPGDVVPSLSSFAFDIWAFETLLPLVAGGAVRLVSREHAAEPERLLGEIADATLLHAVPALMQHLVEAAAAADGALPALRGAFVGGDAVPGDLLRRMRETFGPAEAWVLYGPTEGTVLATRHRAADPASFGRADIGRPFPDMSVHVLDRFGGLLPPGMPGELCIGGAGVARGYLGRAGLTADRFVPDPFGGDPGARLYRTGDRVRRHPDGVLEFLGRVDAQLKIRGFRIEPGEIEAVLGEQPGVGGCAVVARQTPSGDRRLVAFVVAAGGAAVPAAAELQARLRERLPDYMVPPTIVALDALPLTSTGKVDRRALATAPVPAEDEAGYTAPRSEAEETLAAIWAGVLEVDRVGVHDNFFARGGHSLLATQVISRVRQAFGVEVPLRAIYEHATVARLAEAVLRLDPRQHGDGPGRIIARSEVDQMLSSVDELSEDELDLLLEGLSAGEGV